MELQAISDQFKMQCYVISNLFSRVRKFFSSSNYLKFEELSVIYKVHYNNLMNDKYLHEKFEVKYPPTCVYDSRIDYEDIEDMIKQQDFAGRPNLYTISSQCFLDIITHGYFWQTLYSLDDVKRAMFMTIEPENNLYNPEDTFEFGADCILSNSINVNDVSIGTIVPITIVRNKNINGKTIIINDESVVYIINMNFCGTLGQLRNIVMDNRIYDKVHMEVSKKNENITVRLVY